MKYAIMFDPGHGGSDSGAAANGILEKDINWKAACEVHDLLVAHGITVSLTRNEDELPSLQDRANRASAWGADLLISVHHNAGGGHGYEIYKSIKGALDDTLADILANEYQKAGQVAHGDGIFTKQLDDGDDYYGVLRYSAELGVPAIISEYCYIDSDDVAHVNNDDGIHNEAVAIAKAVCTLCEVEWEIAPSVPATPIEERIALALVDKGWSHDAVYWQDCMEGKRAADRISLTTILGRAVGLME